MKQVFQNPKSGKLRVEEIISPALKSGGVLVKTNFSLISPGTERGIIELSKKGLLQKAKERPDYVQKFLMMIKTKGLSVAWQVVKTKLETDIALGYSSSGKVIEIGKNIEEFQIGDRVACAGQDYASHAEIVFIPKNLCVKIPANISDEEAAFVTLGAIALQGIRRANLTAGEKVAVIGLGLLGQLAVQILKAYGHPVVGFDINKDQIVFAEKNGMDKGAIIGIDDISSVVDVFSSGHGVDATLVYASSKDEMPIKLAVDICRDKGRIVQIGNVLSNIPWRDFYKKELSYFASCSYGPGRYDKNYEEKGQDYPYGYVRWTEKRNMEEFLRLVSEEKINVKKLITKIFNINEAEKAYELVFNPNGLLHGILLSYPKESKKSDILFFDRKKDEKKLPTEKIINIGIIGLGSFAISTVLPHLKKLKDARLSAVCNSTGRNIKEVAEKFGVDYITNDYYRLIEDKNIDLIICATRHSSHAKIAKEVLLAGKNLYMEKPLALNKENLNEILEIAQNSKGRLFIGFNRRFSYHFKKAKDEFKNSNTPLMVMYRINYPFSEKNHWSYEISEGGRAIGEGCHFVDALQFLIGSNPRRIYSSAIPIGGSIIHEENFIVNIEYQNNSIGTIFYSALGNFKLSKEYIEIYGDNKTMIIEDFKKAKLISSRGVKNFSLWSQNKGYIEEISALIESIKNGSPSPMTLEEIRNIHLTTFKIFESFKDKKSINF